MFKKAAELTITDSENAKGGRGPCHRLNILTPEEMIALNVGSLFGLSTLPPGSSIGYHQHIGTFEVYYMTEGVGVLTENGEEFIMEKGDMSLCPDGSWHGLENKSDKDLTYLAVIFDCK